MTNPMMNRFSSFCVALSAAALLTGGLLLGQAQSQEPKGGWSPTIDGVESQGDYKSPFLDSARIRNVIGGGWHEGETTFEDPNWTGFSSEPSSPRDLKIIRRMGWSPRDVRSHPSFDDWTGGIVRRSLYLSGRGDGRKLLLDLAINPKTFNPRPLDRSGNYYLPPDKPDPYSGPFIKFSAMEVGPDGSFSKRLEDGRSIAGRIPNLIDIDNLFEEQARAIVATYSGLNGLKIYYNKYGNQYRDGYLYTHIDSLRRLMFFDSQHYSEANYRENFALAENLTDQSGKDRDNTKREHVERGKSLLGRDAGDLSVDVRLIVDKATLGPAVTGSESWYKTWVERQKFWGLRTTHDAGPLEERSRNVKNVSCEGLYCKGMLGKLPTTVFTSDAFIPAHRRSLPASRGYEDPKDNVEVVLANQGIYLAFDRSKNNPALAEMTFGAWMDDAGFFVAPSGEEVRLPSRSRFGYRSASRMAAAVGERTGDRPAADATWRGSMVGTAMRGPSEDNFLRGEAELKFDIGDSRLDARFFNIRDYSRFGEQYVTVRGRKPDQIVFPDIPVAADGSYGKKYRKRRGDNHNGSISGAFYGVGHRETAGTFQSRGILGAFGAKKVVPEAPEN